MLNTLKGLEGRISRQIQDYLWDTEVSQVINLGNLGRPKGLEIYQRLELTSMRVSKRPGTLKAINHSEDRGVESSNIKD